LHFQIKEELRYFDSAAPRWMQLFCYWGGKMSRFIEVGWIQSWPSAWQVSSVGIYKIVRTRKGVISDRKATLQTYFLSNAWKLENWWHHW
jgi:hypothetical protein